MLGVIYVEGLGITKDYMQAYTWLTITGSTDKQNQFRQKATDLRDSFADKLTPQQINEAKGLVKSINNSLHMMESGAKPPVLLKGVKPPYTQKARDARAEGIVVLQAVVRKDGSVDNIRIIRWLGYGFDESAISTIENEWLFQPATYKSYPVNFLVDIEIASSIY